MTIPVYIGDGTGTRNKARVSANGQVVTGNYAYDDTVYKELAADNTAYNFYMPKPGWNFIVTGIIAKADKQVSSSVDADVIVYEAGTDATTTVDKTLFQVAMVQDDYITALPLNIKVTEGKYVNAKTTDDDIHMTIMGYYIPV